MSSSDYINEQRRSYSLYVLQMRAIPHASDGLKAAARRVLWTARNGKHFKSATLAGATMPLHPHAAPESTINTLAAPYGNNVPLLLGDGAFGTLLKPTAYGAPRYTSVSVSQFTKDVVFRDIEIAPMQENYDGTLQEPKHFLPLVPLVLLNPQEGIAVGFATSILPRELSGIIQNQIQYLMGRDFFEAEPTFIPTQQYAQDWYETEDGYVKWIFKGTFKKESATTVTVTNLPFGLTHEKFTKKLDKLEEAGTVVDVEDNSKDKYNIKIKFKKGILSGADDEWILSKLGLITNVSENFNVIDFDGQRVCATSYGELLQSYTDWRLCWYEIRYQRLKELLEDDIQKYRDILTAIRKGVASRAKTCKSRKELKLFLKDIEIVNIDYIADLPVYRFTIEEKEKVEKKLKEALQLLDHYNVLLSSEDERRKVYIQELKEIKQKYAKGVYNEALSI